MVSTYLSYDLVKRDLPASLDRVSKQNVVSRQAAYYEANISKITSVDEFMKDYRLYSYAMKAYGLEDMTYAKAFMKKVLESDLADSASFANKLTDTRYREFAAAFNFSPQAGAAQSNAQIDSFVGLYNESLVADDDNASNETTYFNSMMDRVRTADGLLNDDRLRSYLLTSYGIKESYYSRDVVKGVLSSDTSDPTSYINTTLGVQRTNLNAKVADAEVRLSVAVTAADKAKIQSELSGYKVSLGNIDTYFAMADAFNFASDGTMPAEGAQTNDQKAGINALYYSRQDRKSLAAAQVERDYVNAKIAAATSVSDILTDTRVYSYIKTAYGLNDATIVRSTIEQILTSDLSDPTSYANTFGATRPAYLQLARAFNFNTAGTVEAGSAQTTAQAGETASLYLTRYDDIQEDADKRAIQLYKTAISEVDSVDGFLSDPNVLEFSLRAVGIDPGSVTKTTLKKVLTSDLNDTKSYVYTLNDERFLTLAKAFNFTKAGAVAPPPSAQTEGTIKAIASDYIVKSTRFLDNTKQLGTKQGEKGLEKITAMSKAKEIATAETQYYSEKMLSIKNASEFINDQRLINVLLTAYDIDPKSVDKSFLKQLFASDLSDPKSFVNKQSNRTWAEILGTFNFDSSGAVVKQDSESVQTLGKVIETENRFNRQTLEEEQGESNNGVRLALYFERMSKSITSAYDIIGDTALLEFFTTTFQLPDEFSNQDVDKQAALIKKYMNMEDLKDPSAVSKLINKFTALYDLENYDPASSALSLLTGNSANNGLSGDLLYSIAKSR